jgi:predicted DNA-binding ribbon-helix-helix protein
MQTLDNRLFLELEKMARGRGITVQQLLRAVVVPEWFKNENPEKSREISGRSVSSRHKQRVRRLVHRLPA